MPDPAKAGPLALALIGIWKLRRYVDVTAGTPDYHPFGLHPQGLLTYTRDGYVSALLMAPGRAKLSGNGLTDGTPEEYATAGKGFIGYSGTYQVEEHLSMVTHYPIVAFAPNMVGSAQERAVELNCDVLVLTARPPHEPNSPQTQSRLEWTRVKFDGSEETR